MHHSIAITRTLVVLTILGFAVFCPSVLTGGNGLASITRLPDRAPAS